MKRILLLIFLLISIRTYCQDYEKAFGIRIGGTSGFFYKKFSNDVDAIQYLLSFKRGGSQLTLLRQYYEPVFLEVTDRLFFHYGFGGHLGFSTLSNEVFSIYNKTFRKEEFSLGFGIDAMLGVEFRILRLPLVVSFDFKPSFDFNIPWSFNNNNIDFAFTLIYTF